MPAPSGYARKIVQWLSGWQTLWILIGSAEPFPNSLVYWLIRIYRAMRDSWHSRRFPLSLKEKGELGKNGYMYMYGWVPLPLCCSSETITTLLTVYTLIIIITVNRVSPQIHDSGVLYPHASWLHFSRASSLTRPLLAAVCWAPSEPQLLWVTQCPRDLPPRPRALCCLDWFLTLEGGDTDSQPFFFPQTFSQCLFLSRSHLYSNTVKATFIFMTAFLDKKGYRTQHQKIHYSLGVRHWRK